MAIGDIFSASIEKLVRGGEGLAVIDGKKVFIPLSAPGDRLEARITEEHPQWARAEITGLTEASPDRVEPRCPLFGNCGGCNLQHISYHAQIAAKKAILVEALEHSGGTEALPECTVVPSPPWEYRNRLSFHAIRANSGPRCGFKARKSARVIPVPDCPLADPGIRSVLGDLRPPPGKDRFTLYSRGGTLLAEEGTGSGGGDIPSRGTITLRDREITLDGACFFQSNAAALEALIPVLREAAEKAAGTAGEGRMADLYAGVGTFSLFLADLFPRGADLLEFQGRSLGLAKENLRRLGPGGAGRFRFFSLKDEDWARKQRLEDYAFAVADPPRQGISPALVRRLCERPPQILAYVSCEPSSLARDYRILKQSYTLEGLWFFDFYPQIAHIESLGIFYRK
ncbi:MAG: TRAM domain-containing protein [Treponema sp.]|jgi:23S rRNA (uracil1939-C5)-methyltransferase|nr:TRAM domain-containing protein [Treponema sp.]